MVETKNTMRPGANSSKRALTPEERQRLIAQAESLHRRRQATYSNNSARVQATSQKPKKVDSVKSTQKEIIKNKQKLENTCTKRVEKVRSPEEQRMIQALREKEQRRYDAKHQHKVVKSKPSSYSKKNKSLYKKGVRNLKVVRNSIITLILLGFGAFQLYKSGLVQDLYSDYQMKKAMEEAQEAAQNQTVTIPGVDLTQYEEELGLTTEEEEVIEEKHETINTDMYDEGYEFRSDITPEFLNNLNPIVSRDTAWLEIPGTKIDYAFVSPSTANIDQVPGLREQIDASGKDDRTFMNYAFLHWDLNLNQSSKGTLFLDLYNRPLICHYEDLSDMNIIYGHHMSDKSMFNGLMKWKTDSDGSYNAEHPYGIIYTSDGYGYKVTFIASQILSGTDVQSLHPYNFDSYEDKCAYIQNMIDTAHENGWFALDDYEVQEDDKFMSFVTCTYEYDNARFQLIGVMQRIKVRDSMYCYDENGYYVEENTSATLDR